MTQEGKKDTEPWIESKQVKYAYAYDKGGKLQSKLGVSGIPHAFLIDAHGKIVWEGHPGELPDSVIESAISGALAKPLFDLPPVAAALKAALLKHNYAGALAEAGKLSEADGGPELKVVVQSIIAGRVKSMKSAFDEGDLLSAQESATALKKELEGLPELPEADKTLGDIKASKDVDKVIAAQKKVRAIEDEKLGKRAELEKAYIDLKRISKDFTGTFVAKQAEDLMAKLQKRKAAPK